MTDFHANLRRLGVSCLASVLVTSAAPALAQDTDTDALALTSAPEETSPGASGARIYVEGALGAVDQRDGSGWSHLERLSLDGFDAWKFGPDWRAVLSARLDAMHPADPGTDPFIASLREAYVSWQPAGGSTAVDLGRINQRYGPAYGYNPTDFFRANALRTVTNLNPLALRENRLGTFVLRGQRFFGDNAVSLAWAPKLADGPSTTGISIDAGATNDRNRGLLVYTTRLNERISGQFLLYKESGRSVQVGASATALLADAVVAFAEASRGKEPSLVARAFDLGEPAQARNRVAAGLTLTPFSQLSITAEYQYNGQALDKSGWDNLARAGDAALGRYLYEAQIRQDLSSRSAWFTYATLKDAGYKNLDITAFARFNADDRSRQGWVELRYHWPRVDVSLQLQAQGGRAGTQYALYPYSRAVQLMAAYHL